ncbi:hypothetical protein GCK32_011825, partial [Trichostrongylus colubriformis]
RYWKPKVISRRQDTRWYRFIHRPSLALCVTSLRTCLQVCVDGGQFLTKKLFNDIIDPTLYAQVALFMIPLWLQRILSYPMKLIFPRLANMMQSMALNTGGEWSDHRNT